MEVNNYLGQCKIKQRYLETSRQRKEPRPHSCQFGKGGTCCRMCSLGPCQVVEGVEELRGVCGATGTTVVARNFARMIAVGVSLRSEHAQDMLEIFSKTIEEIESYPIDKEKVYSLANNLGINSEKDIKGLALKIKKKLLDSFGQQIGELPFLKYAPKKRYQIWYDSGLIPRGINREVVEILHRTHIGVDQNYKSILKASLRCALADGWGSSMIICELMDALFGIPKPIHKLSDILINEKEVFNNKMLGLVVMIVECQSTKLQKEIHIELIKELINNNILVIVTGCGIDEIDQSGLFSLDTIELAGKNIQPLLKRKEISPVLYLGSCVENSRLLNLFTKIVTIGRVSKDLSDLPVVICAPYWFSENTITVGHYFVASGFISIFGPNLPIFQSKIVTNYLFYEIKKLIGGKWQIAKKPSEFASLIIDQLTKNK